MWKYRGGGADAVFTNTSIAKMGQHGSKVLPYAPSGTKWMAGSSVEVGWAIRYNHGGGEFSPVHLSPLPTLLPTAFARAGYQYRLCPKGEELTEECFQRTPLAFARDKQALLWNNGTRLAIRGVFVDQGTTPPGSTWVRAN